MIDKRRGINNGRDIHAGNKPRRKLWVIKARRLGSCDAFISAPRDLVNIVAQVIRELEKCENWKKEEQETPKD